MTREQPERDEQVLKKLSKLFVQTPETADLEASAEELQAYGVNVERLSRRIQGIVDSAAEKECLAWLDEYRQLGAIVKGRSRRIELPASRAERIRMIGEIQKRSAERGLPTAIGFKELKIEALSDEDLGRIIQALLEAEQGE